MRPVPVPMFPDEIISIKEAAYRADTSERTVRRWCFKHGIGRQAETGAPIQVSAVALEMRACGDDDALEKLRLNKRDDPRVLFYLDRVGVKA